MKKLLLPLLLCTPSLIFAQKKTGLFIKEHLYVKVSPALLYIAPPSDMLDSYSSFLSPAIFGAVGAKMRYGAIGFSAGYFNMKNTEPVTPLGIDLTLTDFKNKVFPAITFQWHKTHFSEYYSAGRMSYEILGKEMYSIGAGGAFRAIKTTKVLTILGLSKLRTNRTDSYHSPYGTSSHHYKDKQYILFFAVSVVL